MDIGPFVFIRCFDIFIVLAVITEVMVNYVKMSVACLADVVKQLYKRIVNVPV